MKKCLIFTLLAMSIGSVAKADVLALDFSTDAARQQTTVGTTSPGWFATSASSNIRLTATGGQNGTYNLDLNNARKFAGGGLYRMTINHAYNFAVDGLNNPADGGALFLQRVGDAAWTQITTSTLNGYDGAIPALGGIQGFGGDSGGALNSIFEFNTLAGSDYLFRFQGGLNQGAVYGNSSPAWTLNSVNIAAVPEPGTLILGAVSAVLTGGGFGLRRLRLKKKTELNPDSNLIA